MIYYHQRRTAYLQDCFIDKILAPRFPITHPIFPWGTSRTHRVSSSGASSSAIKLSAVMKQLESA